VRRRDDGARADYDVERHRSQRAMVGGADMVLTLVGAVVPSLIGWVMMTLNKKLDVSIDDSMRNALQTANQCGRIGLE
jgi:hypothetical protein